MPEEDKEKKEIWCASCGKLLRKEEDVYYEEKTDLPYCSKCAKEKTYEAQREKPLSKEEMLEQRVKDLELGLSYSDSNIDRNKQKLGVLGILFGLSGLGSFLSCFIFPYLFPFLLIMALVYFGLCYYFLSD